MRLAVSVIGVGLLVSLALLSSASGSACQAPPRIHNAWHSGGSRSYFRRGERVTYRCKSGYRLAGESQTLTCVYSRYDQHSSRSASYSSSSSSSSFSSHSSSSRFFWYGTRPKCVRKSFSLQQCISLQACFWPVSASVSIIIGIQLLVVIQNGYFLQIQCTRGQHKEESLWTSP